MVDSLTSDGALAPLVIIGSPRSGTTFLSHMVNRFFDMRLSRDNGTVLRFHRLLKHYEPLSDAANLRRLIKHLYADRYFQDRLIARGLSLSEAQLFERVHPRTYAALVAAVFGATAETYQRGSWGYKRASMARSTTGNVNAVFPSARIVPNLISVSIDEQSIRVLAHFASAQKLRDGMRSV